MPQEREADQLSERLRIQEMEEPPVVFDSYTGVVNTPPSAAQINAAFGATAAELRDGWTGVIDDTVNGNTWACVSENDAWRVFGEYIADPVHGTGTPPEVAFWRAADEIAGDPGMTYDAVNDRLQLTPAADGGIDFLGATGTNRIQVPDNLVSALFIDDAGGVEYLKIISSNVQPRVVVNDGGADVDFRVEASGVAGALFVRGSDGYTGFGTQAPATRIESQETIVLGASPADGYAAAITLDPGYSGAFTVTRHNYIDVNQPGLGGGAAVTDGAVMRFDAAIGTHVALAAAFTTTDDNSDLTNWALGVIINVQGTLYKIPAIAL